MTDPTILEELGRYDQDFMPAPTFDNLPDVQELPDGIYACAITGTNLDRTKNDRTPILKLTLQATGPVDVLCGRAFLLRDQGSYDRLGADLIALGFDANNWTPANKRPFSAELAKVLSSGKLVGLRFQARKRRYDKVKGSKAQDGWSFDICGLLRAPQGPQGGTGAVAARTAPPRQGKAEQAAAVIGAANGAATGETIPF